MFEIRHILDSPYFEKKKRSTIRSRYRRPSTRKRIKESSIHLYGG